MHPFDFSDEPELSTASASPSEALESVFRQQASLWYVKPGNEHGERAEGEDCPWECEHCERNTNA